MDTATGTVAAQIPAGSPAETAAFDPVSGLVAVMGGSAEVTLIDTKLKAAVASIPVEESSKWCRGTGQGHLFINLETNTPLRLST